MNSKEQLKDYFTNNPEKFAVIEEAVKESNFKKRFNEAFEDVTLADGSIVMVEPSVEVGAAVAYMDEEGNLLPAPDATHELQDGRSIVTEAGIILEVIEATAEEAEEPAAEALTEEKMEEAPTPKTVIERTEIERKFEEMEAKHSKELESLKSEFNKVTETNNELLEILKSFATEEPTNAPRTHKKTSSLKEFRKNLRQSLKHKNN